jgi:hypothetical protein
MANPENLIPNDQRTPSQRRENARKAGKASGEARRKRKAMREAFDILLSRQYGSNGSDGVEVLAAKVFQKALDGDMKAVTFIRDTVGEMPVQKIETVTIAPETYERVQSVLDSFEAPDDTGVQPDERV